MRSSQKLLYDQFCSYAYSICGRYSHREEDAMEVLNDGFMKVFTHIGQFHHPESYGLIPAFKGWLKKIMVFTSIDHYRSRLKHSFHQDIQEYGEHLKAPVTSALDQISHKELMEMVQQLSPGYRLVFNLFAIDGYSHEEISGKLGISVGTSKSNLAKARINLRKMLQKSHEEIVTRYEG